MSNEPNPPQGQIFVIWVIWFALMMGVCVLRFVIVGPSHSTPDESSVWQVMLVPVAIATFLRWNILPRVRSFANLLPVFIVGMALSEAACITGTFVFTPHRDELFLLGVLGMAQFIPIYAKRIIDGGGEP